MSSSITLTAALRSNLLSLQGTQSLLDITQFRLATGKKVNSALDNPNAFFTSAALSNRANDLSALLDGEGQAIQTLTAADQGITSLTKLVQQAQSIAQSARDSLSITAMARSADFSAATVANLTAAGTASAGFANNDTLTLTSGNGNATTFTITTGMSMAALVSQINATNDFTAQIVDGSDTALAATGGTGTKRLEIRATNGNTLALTGTASGLTKLIAGNATSSVVSSISNTYGIIVSGAPIPTSSNTPDQITLQRQYDALRTQIDQLISDTGYRGVNLLNGDSLVTQFNERNTSKQTVVGVTFNASGLGITQTYSTTAGSNGFRDSTAIAAALDQITTALGSLRTQAQSFGNNLSVIQTRQDFTTNLVNILKAGSDKLTLADKNEEGANLLSLQTSQQLGIQALSLASQANQSVLRLFQ